VGEISNRLGRLPDRTPRPGVRLVLADRRTTFAAAVRSVLERAAFEVVQAENPDELKKVALAARGEANREIGRALVISEFTVERHMHSILRKLGLDSRRDAAVLYEEARGTNTGGAAFGAHERIGGIAGLRRRLG